MQLGTHVGMLATILAIFALAIGSVAVMEPGVFHTPAAGPQGPTGPSGTAGHNGAHGGNGTNGLNGTNGQNGTNGNNGTTWLTLWYGLNPTFQATGALTYLTVVEAGCTDAGQGAYYCLVSVTNTCGPESGVHAEWACAAWYYGLANVSFPVNGSFCFTGSDPSLGYAVGWGQTVTVQLWFQTIVYGEYASGSSPPSVPTLTPVVELGFAEVSG